MYYKNLIQYKYFSKDEPEVVIDFETNGLPPFGGGVVLGLGITFPRKGKSIFVDVNEYSKDKGFTQVINQTDWEYILKNLATKKIIAHNISFELLWVNELGFDIDCYWCTRIAQYLLTPEMVEQSSYYSLDYMIETYLQKPSHKKEFKQHLRSKAKEHNISEGDAESKFYLADKDVLATYCLEDCERTYELYTIQKPMIENVKAYDFMKSLPLEYIRLLNKQYKSGMCVNSNRLGRVVKNQTKMIEYIDKSFLKFDDVRYHVENILEKRIEEKASKYKKEKNRLNYIETQKESFNFNSSQQKAELFTRLEIPIEEKTPSNQMATSNEVLSKYKEHHPLISLLVKRTDYETSRKYAEQYIKVVDKDNRYHMECEINGTASGRLVAYEPNFLAIPRRDKRLMKCFTISNENNILLSFDFKQLEPYVLTHFTEDDINYNVVKYGYDLYLEHIKYMMPDKLPLYNRDDLKGSKERLHKERDLLKKAVLGLNYGMGANKLSYNLKIPLDEARVMFKGYWEAHYKIRNFANHLVYLYSKDGYVDNLFGRPLFIGNMKDIVNRFIQSSGHDCLVALNIILFENLSKIDIDCKPIVMDFHDEGIFEIAKKDVDIFLKVLYNSLDELNKQINLKLPLEIDFKISTDMGGFK